MSRRSRQRKRETTAPAMPPRSTDRMARVRVSDDVWSDFRDLAGQRPVAVVLGDLVTREVGRHRSRRLQEGNVGDRELVDALDRAREQQSDLAAIVERLEHLSASKRGA